MATQGTSKEERFKNLRRSGLSAAEANRWVYGWSDPAMKTLWQDVMKSRPKGSPQFTQKEAFKIVLKTVFGRDYAIDRELVLSHESYKEVIEVVVEGIEAGHIATRAIKHLSPERKDLVHKARSEFKRLLQHDPDFANFVHQKDEDA